MAPRAEPDLWGLGRPKLVKIHEGGTRQETNASARPTCQAQCIVQQLNNLRKIDGCTVHTTHAINESMAYSQAVAYRIIE